MKKKSHISLAKLLVRNMKVQDLSEHKKAFYIGSILPDLKPSFFTKRHTIENTFDDLVGEIKKVTTDYDAHKGINAYYARHLGVITHYLADYCTYPHNSIFTGTLSEHIQYEKELKSSMKEYVDREETQKELGKLQTYRSPEEIISFIKWTHKEYLKALKKVEKDIEYIIYLCHKVVEAIILFFELAQEKIYAGMGNRYNLKMEYNHA